MTSISAEDLSYIDSFNVLVENLPYVLHNGSNQHHSRGKLRKHTADSSSSDSSSSSSDDDATATPLSEEKEFTQLMLQDARVKNLVMVWHILGEHARGTVQPEPDLLQALRILSEVVLELRAVDEMSHEIVELGTILTSPHVQALLSVYDDVIHRAYEVSLPPAEEGALIGVMSTDSLSVASSQRSRNTEASNSLKRVVLAPQFAEREQNGRTSVSSRGGANSSRASSRVQPVEDDGSFRHRQQAAGKTSQSDTLRSSVSVVDRTPQIIGISRDPGQPLGITVTRVDSFVNGKVRSDIVVERILADSLIDRQGIIHVGDIIVSMNDMTVDSPDALQRILRQMTTSTLTMKIIPGPRRFISAAQARDRMKAYVRTFFSYNPSTDTLLPTGNVGLSFEAGDILEVVDKTDPHYWQARRLGSSRIGLIPSSILEERRKAFNPADHAALQANGFNYCAAPAVRKKKTKTSKKLFRVVDAPVFSEVTDIWSYEDVVQVPAIPVKCLVLIGPSGVGRRSLKQLICQMEPEKFACPTPDTTQVSALSDGHPCRYISRGQMEVDIKNGLYLEWAEMGNELYGIRLQAVRDIVAQGKTVVLDCQPTSVRLLRQPEFNPHVVFIAAPSVDVLRAMQRKGQSEGLDVAKRTDEDFRLMVEQSAQYERLYRHLYQSVFLNDNVPLTAKRLVNLVRRLERQPQWIPVAWEEDLAPQHQFSVASGNAASVLQLDQPADLDDRNLNAARSPSVASSQPSRISVNSSTRIPATPPQVTPRSNASSRISSVSSLVPSQGGPGTPQAKTTPKMLPPPALMTSTAASPPPPVPPQGPPPLPAYVYEHSPAVASSSSGSSTVGSSSSASTPRGGPKAGFLPSTSLNARPNFPSSSSSSSSSGSDQSSDEEAHPEGSRAL